MRLIGYLPGSPVIGFYGMFERNFGCPDTPEPLSLVVPSSEGGTILPFSCPRCGDPIDFRSPGSRACYHDGRRGRDESGRQVVRDNYFCPHCGWRFRLDLRGRPLRAPVYGQEAAPAWVESPDGSTRELDAPTILGELAARCAYAAHVIGAGVVAPVARPRAAMSPPSPAPVVVPRLSVVSQVDRPVVGPSRPWAPPSMMRAGVPGDLAPAILPPRMRGSAPSISLPRPPVARPAKRPSKPASRDRLLAAVRRLQKSSSSLAGRVRSRAGRGSPSRVADRAAKIASSASLVASRLLGLASGPGLVAARRVAPAYVRAARVVAGADAGDAQAQLGAARAAYADALASAEQVKSDLRDALVARDLASSNAPEVSDPAYPAWLSAAEAADAVYRAAMEDAAALIFQDTTLADAREALAAAQAFADGGAGGDAATDEGGAAGGGGSDAGGGGGGGGGAGGGDNPAGPSPGEGDDAGRGEEMMEPPSYRGDDVPNDRLPDPEEAVDDADLVEDFDMVADADDVIERQLEDDEFDSVASRE